MNPTPTIPNSPIIEFSFYDAGWDIQLPKINVRWEQYYMISAYQEEDRDGEIVDAFHSFHSDFEYSLLRRAIRNNSYVESSWQHCREKHLKMIERMLVNSRYKKYLMSCLESQYFKYRYARQPKTDVAG